MWPIFRHLKVKAFDKVLHDGLLCKLHFELKVSKYILIFIKDFLINRSLKVHLAQLIAVLELSSQGFLKDLLFSYSSHKKTEKLLSIYLYQ